MIKRPAVFFDRDNTLIVSDGFLGDPGKVVLVEGAADAIAKARQYGFKVVTVSNQSGVARGLFDEEAVLAVNQRMDELLREANPAAIVEHHEYCPYHPEAKIEKYRHDSDLRKPRPGMILRAAEELSLDLARSWVIGDAPRDIAAGKAAGCRTILFQDPKLPPSPAVKDDLGVKPEFTVASLREAVELVAREAFRSDEPAPEPKPAPAADLQNEPNPSTKLQNEPSHGPRTTDHGPGLLQNEPTLKEEEPMIEEATQEPSPTPPSDRTAESKSTVLTPPVVVSAPPVDLAKVESLLTQVLGELKRQREDLHTEFSVSKLFAGIVQVVALGALFMAYLNRDSANMPSILLFAIALQTLTIALLIMGRQR